jgi:hypothetical protein
VKVAARLPLTPTLSLRRRGVGAFERKKAAPKDGFLVRVAVRISSEADASASGDNIDRLGRLTSWQIVRI